MRKRFSPRSNKVQAIPNTVSITSTPTTTATTTDLRLGDDTAVFTPKAEIVAAKPRRYSTGGRLGFFRLRSCWNEQSPKTSKKPAFILTPPRKLHQSLYEGSSGGWSMGVGSLSVDGVVENFTPSPRKPTIDSIRSVFGMDEHDGKGIVTSLTFSDDLSSETATVKKTLITKIKDEIVKQPVVFRRALSSFLRVADLQMDIETVSLTSNISSEDGFLPNFHCVSADPPPGVDADPQELWVALDDGAGAHAPIAPYAVRALASTGRQGLEDSAMWTPDGKTAKLLKSCDGSTWFASSFQKAGNVVLKGDSQEKEVLVWSGSFSHGCYGSDLPAVRAAGIIPMSPEALMDLLVDSSRVKEYNSLSLGRTDLLKLQDDMSKDGPFGGITKVMRSETKPPMMKKMQFTSILHARELEDGSGFTIVTRAVTTPEEQGAAAALKSEILLGVNLIKRIEGDPSKSLLLTVNHIRSPMVPLMIAKRIGLQSAVNFFHDVRGCC